MPIDEVFSFWYSKKHDEYLRCADIGVTSIEINGTRVVYTEAQNVGKLPICSTERGGKFDDYVHLGDTTFETFQRTYTEMELLNLNYRSKYETFYQS